MKMELLPVPIKKRALQLVGEPGICLEKVGGKIIIPVEDELLSVRIGGRIYALNEPPSVIVKGRKHIVVRIY